MIHSFGGITVVLKPVIFLIAGKLFQEGLPPIGNILLTGVGQQQIGRVVSCKWLKDFL